MFPTSPRWRLILPVLLLGVTGCSNQGGDPTTPNTQATPVVSTLPEFTAGTSVTLTWSAPGADKGGSGRQFEAQSSTDDAFEVIAAETDWIDGTEALFEDLPSGTKHHFRVRSRGPFGRATAWSEVHTTTTDDAGPLVAASIPDTTRTSLLFNLELSAEDSVSGLDQLELWFRVDGGDLVNHGPVEVGSYPFLADGQGQYEFFLVATDVAGNRVEPTEAALAVYEAPEPIIIVDRRGESFDITNAVLKHGIHVMFWDHGIGRHTIRPVIDPVMIGPGHRHYPPDTNFEQVCAVSFDGDNRAYRLTDLNDKEVANDTVAGVPIAVSY